MTDYLSKAEEFVEERLEKERAAIQSGDAVVSDEEMRAAVIKQYREIIYISYGTGGLYEIARTIRGALYVIAILLAVIAWRLI